MPLQPNELATLQYFSFTGDYGRYRMNLIDVGRQIYQAYRVLLRPGHEQEDMEQPLSAGLLYSNVFRRSMSLKIRAYQPRSLYPGFALLLAKYVIDRDWTEITNVP